MTRNILRGQDIQYGKTLTGKHLNKKILFDIKGLTKGDTLRFETFVNVMSALHERNKWEQDSSYGQLIIYERTPRTHT